MKVVHLAGSPLSRALIDAVLVLVEENLISLSAQVLTIDSPLYGLARAKLIQEIRLYLEGIGQPGIPFHLMAAFQEGPEGDHLVGFMVFTTRVRGEPSVAGLNYTAVAEPNRRRGVLKSMMAALQAQYPIVALTCSIENVPVYERLGFYPTGARQTHVIMESAPLTQGQTMCVDMEMVDATSECVRERRALREKYGENEGAHYAAFNAAQLQEARRVKLFLAQRGIVA